MEEYRSICAWANSIWKKVAQYVPGRTHVQCRERWVNSLDPSLKLDEWTEEEDLKLKSAIDVNGYSWSKVAACVPPRTDNQCRRRWMALFPGEVPMLQVAKKIRREAFISNFVDREEERPALRPDDIVLTDKFSYRAGCETTSANKKRKLRRRAAKDDMAPRCDAICEREKRHSEGSEQGCNDAIKNKRLSKRHPRKTKKLTPNDQVPEASSSSMVESTIADGNSCKRRRRTSSLVKKKSKAIASASSTVESTTADGNICKRRRRTSSLVKIKRGESSSSLPNLSSSMTVVEEAESLVQDSRKAKNIMDKRHSASEYDDPCISPQGPPLARPHLDKGTADLDVGENSGASGCHKLNKCNELKNNDRSSIDNLPETADDCMTLASFVRKSRAKGCSLSSAKVARLCPDKAQSKAMAGDHSIRPCVSRVHDGMEKRTTQECTSSNQISGIEVGDDDMPLSLFMGRVKREKTEVGDDMPLSLFMGRLKRGKR